MRLKLIALAILSGLLLSLAWLRVSGIILCFAFIPLLFINNYFVENRKSNTSFVFWLYSLIAFACWNILATWWIWNATPIGAVFAIVVNTFLMSIIWWLFHFAHRQKGAGFAGLFLIFAWLSFEYLHYNWELCWPWLNLGNGLANDVAIIQWYEYTGVFGGSVWILVVNLLLWNLLKKYAVSFEKINLAQYVPLAIVVIIPVVFSLKLFINYNEIEDPVNVVILQPNIDPYHDKFDGISPDRQYEILLQLADSIADEKVDFFIGPETALHNVWQNSVNNSYPVHLIRNFLNTQYPEASFVIGAMTHKEYLKEEKTISARTNSDSTFFYDAFNSALFINSIDSLKIYHKSKLVSGVELLPYNKYLKFVEKLVVDLGGTTGTLATENKALVFEKNETIVGVPICFESVFGEYTSQFIQKGANVLFIITNDGWWNNTPGYKQHLSFSRIQAIEFRRSIARSANTGISCIINQKGQIEQQSKWWKETSIKGALNRNSIITFYAKNGDYIARISLFMFFLMGLNLVVVVLKRDKKKEPHYSD